MSDVNTLNFFVFTLHRFGLAIILKLKLISPPPSSFISLYSTITLGNFFKIRTEMASGSAPL